MCSATIKTKSAKGQTFSELFHFQDRWYVNYLHHTCTYNRFPEDEASGSKHAEDIVKLKILV